MSKQPQTPPLHDCVHAHLEAYFNTLGDEAEATQIWSMVMQCVEKATLEMVMEKSQFNQSKAAEMLGITRNTLRKKLLSYEILK
ncbi:MAG: helix-turn-helix domain-containing protein [Alcaligenaceae bacterium]|nr:helix-turn-helix domain-containing protein [Alcaligenaceae bacterium]